MLKITVLVGRLKLKLIGPVDIQQALDDRLGLGLLYKGSESAFVFCQVFLYLHTYR